MLKHHRADGMLRAVFGQSALAFSYRCAGAAVSLVFSIVFARIMSIDEYGVVVSLLSCCGIAAMIGLLGQQTQLLRDIPKLVAQQSGREITEITSRRLALMACGSLAATALGVFVFVAGHDRIRILSHWEYAICVLLIVPLALIEMQSAIGCALGSMHLAIGTKEVLWRLSVSLLALPIFLIWGRPLAAGVVLGLAVLAIWVAVGIQQARVKRLLNGYPLFSLPAVFAESKKHLNFRDSIPFWTNSVANLMLATMGTVAVSVIVGPETGAYYYTANRIALLLDFFISAFSVPAAPYIARLHHAGDRAQISRIASSAALLSVTAVLGALILLGFTGDLVLRVFGNAFVRAHGIMMLLAIGALVSAYLGIGTPALEMTGHQEPAMRITAITAFAGLITTVIATYLFGVWGAASVAVLLVVAQKTAFAAHMYLADGIDVTAGSATIERLNVLVDRCWNKGHGDESVKFRPTGFTDINPSIGRMKRGSLR